MSAGLPPLGAVRLPDGRVTFTVWAPNHERVSLVLTWPAPREIAMRSEPGSYFTAMVEDVEEEARYCFRLDGGPERPDPASRFQPEGVHAASQVVSPEFDWQSAGWKGLPLEQYVLYEVHVGTFTPEGTFDAAIGQLPRLAALGVTALEIMPVAQFPGNRNWGYDGVHPFAAAELVRRPCRASSAWSTPATGSALPWCSTWSTTISDRKGTTSRSSVPISPSDTARPGVRRSTSTAPQSRRGPPLLHRECACTGSPSSTSMALRLDAVHAITDVSAVPFLEELGEAVHRQAEALGQGRLALSPESDRNDARLVRPAPRAATAWTPSGTTTFTTRCTLCSPGNSSGYYADLRQLRPGRQGLSRRPTSTPASIRGFAAGGTAVLPRGSPAASSSSSRRTTTRSATACWASASPP